MLVATASGYILEWTGSYMSLFIMAGSMYLIALAIIHLLLPRMSRRRGCDQLAGLLQHDIGAPLAAFGRDGRLHLVAG